MATGNRKLIINCFDLPTQQGVHRFIGSAFEGLPNCDVKRLRHLRSLAVRNLSWKGESENDLAQMQTYFTLHLTSSSKALYTSERITGSLNPTWQSFDLPRLDASVDSTSKYVLVRIWCGLNKTWKLFMEWNVHLTGLHFLTDKLQQEDIRFASDSLIFGMFDKFFCKRSDTPEQGAELSLADLTRSVIKVDMTVIRNSYGVSSLSRIHTVLRAIKQTRVSVKRVHRSIEDRLLESQDKTRKMSDHEELLLRVNQLRNELSWQNIHLQAEHDTHQLVRNALRGGQAEARDRTELMKQYTTELDERKRHHIETRENLIKTNAQLNMRRKQLMTELSTFIYPITEVGSKPDYFINSIKLPNSEQFQGHDENMIAVAIGYTCHLLVMTTRVLNVPMWYECDHRGSRSTIADHIISKLADKDRTFPLFSKGKDKFQFNYGVFLLNKNISQLRLLCGLGTADLRLTLQNIRSLLESRLGVKFERPPLRPLTPAQRNQHDSLTRSQSDNRPLIAKRSPNLIEVQTPSLDSSPYDIEKSEAPSSTATSDLIKQNDTKNRHKPAFPDLPVNIGGIDTVVAVMETAEQHLQTAVTIVENSDQDDLFSAHSTDEFFKVSNALSEQGVLQLDSLKNDIKDDSDIPSEKDSIKSLSFEDCDTTAAEQFVDSAACPSDSTSDKPGSHDVTSKLGEFSESNSTDVAENDLAHHDQGVGAQVHDKSNDSVVIQHVVGEHACDKDAGKIQSYKDINDCDADQSSVQGDADSRLDNLYSADGLKSTRRGTFKTAAFSKSLSAASRHYSEENDSEVIDCEKDIPSKKVMQCKTDSSSDSSPVRHGSSPRIRDNLISSKKPVHASSLKEYVDPLQSRADALMERRTTSFRHVLEPNVPYL